METFSPPHRAGHTNSASHAALDLGTMATHPRIQTRSQRITGCGWPALLAPEHAQLPYSPRYTRAALSAGPALRLRGKVTSFSHDTMRLRINRRTRWQRQSFGRAHLDLADGGKTPAPLLLAAIPRQLSPEKPFATDIAHLPHHAPTQTSRPPHPARLLGALGAADTGGHHRPWDSTQ